MHAAWEQAFALMAGHGHSGACGIVVEGMQKTPPDAPEQFRGWHAIAECLNAIAAAAATRH